MTSDWETRHFEKRKQITEDIEQWRAKHHNDSRYSFPAALGLRLHRADVEWWSHYIKDARKRKEFQAAARALVAGKKFKTGMDVPRGVTIEHLYYKIAKGYSDEQYGAHLRSMD